MKRGRNEELKSSNKGELGRKCERDQASGKLERKINSKRKRRESDRGRRKGERMKENSFFW